MPSLNQWDISPAAATRTTAAPTAIRPAALRFVWLEITGSCQLHCGHCYADSSPAGTHGQMTTTDWRRVIGEVAALGAGRVQFIGGEPTMHPDFLELVEHALDQGLRVEVYSNLVRITEAMWEMFRRPGVSLATSWYSDTPTEHQQIVGGNKHAYRNTLANIARARADGIEIRAGLISFTDQQRVDAAERQLARLGITRTGIDHVRGVGRGANGNQPNVDALCGQCANGKLAILPDGDAYPCVFSRWPAMRAGNVLDQPLQEIITGHPLTTTREALQAEFNERPKGVCHPDKCEPNCTPSLPPCDPDDSCSPSCIPGHSAAGRGGACAPGRRGPMAMEAPTVTACNPDDGCDPTQCLPQMTCDPFTKPLAHDGGSRATMCGPDTPCEPDDGCQPNTPVPGTCAPDSCTPDVNCAPASDGCQPTWSAQHAASTSVALENVPVADGGSRISLCPNCIAVRDERPERQAVLAAAGTRGRAAGWTACSPDTDGCEPDAPGSCKPDTDECGPERECQPSGDGCDPSGRR